MTRSHRRPVVAGLGITDMTRRIYGRTAAQFAVDAVRLALDDAGLALGDVNGLLTNAGITRGIGLSLQKDLGLRDLRLLSEIQAYGSSAGAMVQYASMAVESGMVDVVVCVFADAPLQEGGGTGDAYASSRATPAGFAAMPFAAGLRGAPSMYALAARRHMQAYGTTSEQFGAVAVAAREWAARNPLAQMREPITIADHQASRWIAEPLHLLDCCLVSNGAIAVVVTSADRAAALRQPPVHVLGWAQAHPGYIRERNSEFGLVSGATRSGPEALKMAGVTISDVDVAEIYDCFTYTTIVSLEDYGFCEKGEGGPLAESGALGPSGSLRVNTGGGELSSYYLWGMTPLSEAVIQARGQGGDRQSERHDVVLVSGNGGFLDYHSTLILGTGPS
ncbi:thiolase family protein [Pseudonocardia halophobica]|uniref:thiolase family protein n=1 Tax=Pseudonocardia halophobica TaxID=29401 RepID=UPI003D8DC816